MLKGSAEMSMTKRVCADMLNYQPIIGFDNEPLYLERYFNKINEGISGDKTYILYYGNSPLKFRSGHYQII
jgi:hypothetical protein